MAQLVKRSNLRISLSHLAESLFPQIQPTARVPLPGYALTREIGLEQVLCERAANIDAVGSVDRRDQLLTDSVPRRSVVQLRPDLFVDWNSAILHTCGDFGKLSAENCPSHIDGRQHVLE